MEKLIINRYMLSFIRSVGHVMPTWMGYALARFVAGRITSQPESKLLNAVRANQWVISGESATKAELDLAVHTVFQNLARAIYELYHYLQQPDAALKLFTFSPSFQEFLDQYKKEPEGLVLAGLHLCGFDLGLQCIGTKEIQPLLLTLPEVDDEIHRLEFEFRRKMGLNLVHGSLVGLRQAIQHIKNGGIVVTGIDRPMEVCDPRPIFFGRPSPLPSHHIFLALKTKVPIRMVICHLEADRKYHISISPPIEMDEYADRSEAMLRNTEKVLAVAEDFIRKIPHIWSATLPVWPETIDLAPR